MNTLDILNLSLNGISLIEANAGTGKTYNLIIIYLRLLLNLNNQIFYSNPLTVKQILVVTFTKSAVQDLRVRIKENIHQFRLDCIQGYSNNQIFSKLLLKIPNINTAISLLLAAEKDMNMNQESIFTIHSFCQKILTENTLELNMLFRTSIVENELNLYTEICRDFWRKYFYSLPLNITNFIQQCWSDPEALLKDILPYIYGKIPQSQYSKFIYLSGNQINISYNQIIDCINSVKKQWIAKQSNIINIINTFYINRKIYNKKKLQYWIYSITQWARDTTHDHNVPDCLSRFKSSILCTHLNGQKNHMISLFDLIEELFQQLFSFKELIFRFAIQEIRQYLDPIKYSRSQITFNDLINLLFHYGINKKNSKLIKKISSSYPIAIIDEFQDTDSKQYKIFHTIYSDHLRNGLILIGDPKQAIYSFRGADIFTYMAVRKAIPNKYSLSVNWRSSSGMVNAINQLFTISNPFVFKDIPFIPSLSANPNNMYKFFINNQIQPSICFWLHPSNYAITIREYKQAMAKECAIILENLLHNIRCKSAWLITHQNKKKILQNSDIIILVRNHEEALMLKTEFLKKNISTIFLSNRTSIFNTIESYELLLLLKAILFPKRQHICTALTTIFFNINAIDIEKINNNTNEWEKIFSEFSEYYLIWKNHNILSMIYTILFKHKIPETLLITNTGVQNLINILHLGELLNDTYKHLNNEHELFNWLELKILQPSNINDYSNYRLRSYNEQESIKISTIHKSKGLEFPLTFLPFIANFPCKNHSVFHDRTLFKLYLNFEDTKLNSKLSEEEQLSEDLRLLYVAISRSIYYCAIGIAPIIYKQHKKISSDTDVHKSAIGYLIQNKKNGNVELLKNCLHKLHIITNGNISVRFLSQEKLLSKCLKKSENQHLSVKIWTPSTSPTYMYNNLWRITSYSDIKNFNSVQPAHSSFLESININVHDNYQKQNNEIDPVNLTPHTFPKGQAYGIFFHNIFQKLNFTKLIDRQWLKMQMIKHHINDDWEPIVWKWLYNIINTPIDQHILTLSKISNNNKKTEFKFCLTINTNLCSKKLDSLCKRHDYLSSQTSTLTFPKITGMLQGFIDLVFYWNHKYYILDYKTDWLGENNDFYSKFYIENNIIKNHYTLQYQLYTLALHRFLQYHIKLYNYEKNFGGVYYLFIRGIYGHRPNNGVYFCRPIWKFIKQLDNLFYKSENNKTFMK